MSLDFDFSGLFVNEEQELPEDYEGILTQRKEIKEKTKIAQDLKNQEEQEFQDWYKGVAERNRLNPDPDSPEHFYDYRSYFKAIKSGRAKPPQWTPEHKQYRMPDQFKLPGHPEYYSTQPPDTWTLEQTEKFFKSHPAENPADEVLREAFLEKKKGQKEELKNIVLGKEPEGKTRSKIEEKPEITEHKPSFLEKSFRMGREFLRGAEETVLSLPQAFGALIQETGERAEEAPDVFDLTTGIGLTKLISSRLAKKTDIDEKLAAKGKQITEQNKKDMQEYAEYENWLKPEDKTKFEQFSNQLGSGAMTLAGALGISLVTKSPHTAAVVFGLYQKGNIYEEATEKGFIPRKAGRLSTAAGLTEGALEYAGLNFMLSKFGGPIKDIIFRAGSEGLQEWSQQVGENAITQLGGVREFKGFEGLFEGAGRSALIGVMLGVPAAVSVSQAERLGLTKELTDRGLSVQQAKEATETIIKKQRQGIEDFTDTIFEALGDLPMRKAQVIQPFGEEEKPAGEPAPTEGGKVGEQPMAGGMTRPASKEIVAEQITRGEKVSDADLKAYPDLAQVKKQIDFYREEGREPPMQLLQQLGIRQGEKIARAPAAERMLGTKNLIETVTMKESTALRMRLQSEARGAKEGFTAGKELIREQEKVKREVSMIAQKLNNLKNQKLPPEYQEQLESGLDSLGLLERKRPLAAKRSLADFVSEQKEKGEIVPISESELALADYTDMGNATLDLLKRKYQVLKQLSVLGQNQKKIFSLGEEQYYDDIIGGLKESIQKQPQRFARRMESQQGLTPSGRKKSLRIRVAEGLDGLLAPLRKVEFISRAIDGFTDGKFTRTIIEPIQKAGSQEMIANETDFTGFRGLLNKHKIDIGKLFNETVILNYNEAVKIATKEELMGIYLNSLNPGNKQRLSEGWKLSEGQITDATGRLSPGERAFADELQKMVDSKWDKIAKIKELLTGVPMGKVQGYWPIVTDKALDTFSLLREQQTDLFQDVVNRTFVEKGFTKEREGGRAPVELRALKVFIDHISKVNHFITHALPVRDIQKIINNADIKEGISRIMGPEIFKQYPAWLRNVANPKTYVTNSWEKAIRALRMNSTVATLGLKVSVSLVQAGSFTQTVHELGAKDAFAGAVQFYQDPIEHTKFIYENSPLMKYRDKTFDREVREWMDGKRMRQMLENKPEKTSLFFSLIRAVDKAATLPTWWAAYQKSMRVANGDTVESIRFADGVTRRTQPAGAVKDLASVSLGNEWQKLFTMFYTHFTNYHNQLTAAMDKLKMGDESGLHKTADAATALLWLAVIPGLLTKFLTSGGKERDPMEYAKSVGSYFFSGIPLIRDMANSAFQQRYYDITSPAFGGFETLAKAGGEIVRPVYGKEIRPGKLAEETIKGAGYLTGLPTQQAWVTLDGIIDMADGKTSDPRRLLLSEYQMGEQNKGRISEGGSDFDSGDLDFGGVEMGNLEFDFSGVEF